MTPGTQAAVRAAARLGLEVGEPFLIQETNNTVVWLRPHPIIAKVGTHDYSAITLNHEYEVASSLQEVGAPVAPPWLDMGLITDSETGYSITLWCRQKAEPGVGARDADIGRSLKLLHGAMARIDVQLPSFRDGIAQARRALTDDARVAALAVEDRDFLRRSFAELERRLEVAPLSNKLSMASPTTATDDFCGHTLD